VFPTLKNLLHPAWLFGVPDHGAPVGSQNQYSATRSKYSIDFPESLIQVGNVFQHLDSIDTVKIGVFAGKRQYVPDLAFHPRKLGTPITSGSNLILTDIDRADATSGPDTLRGFARIESPSAPNF
jgi:hypothetical protein